MPETRYLILGHENVAHVADADDPTTALCGTGAWEKHLADTPKRRPICAPCEGIADFEGGYPIRAVSEELIDV